jgi:hypothetical protein
MSERRILSCPTMAVKGKIAGMYLFTPKRHYNPCIAKEQKTRRAKRQQVIKNARMHWL